MAEQGRADRPREKRDPKRRQRGERGRGRIGRREEQPRKDEHRGGGVDIEIEELDSRANQAGEEDLARRVDRCVGLDACLTKSNHRYSREYANKFFCLFASLSCR